jgi:hypothetical protein
MKFFIQKLALTLTGTASFLRGEDDIPNGVHGPVFARKT